MFARFVVLLLIGKKIQRILSVRPRLVRRQLERHIINFVGRDAMDIKGFGTAYIEELIRQGYLADIADI